MRYVHTQSGAALIVLLTIFILGSLTFLLSEANERSHHLVEDQEQTIRALAQAKESLLGFAATYAQAHDFKLQGYLPCPDKDGDGALKEFNDCKAVDKPNSKPIPKQTIMGRFPWRTLGLPPLRDGSGECLWYVVSGNFKNSIIAGNISGTIKDINERILTSDSNGRIEIRNAKDEIITGNTRSERAIAAILAPGRAIERQENRYETTHTRTECGSEVTNNVIEPVNDVRSYLDKYNFEGVVVDNVTAGNSIYITKSGFFATKPTNTNVVSFINAPPVYETYLHPQDGTKQLDRANPTFNDTLVTITPEDFKPVYRMMDYQVATRVRACLDRYAQKSLYHFMNLLQTDISSESNNPFIFVKKFLEITNLKDYSTNEEIKKGILDKIKASIATKEIPYPKYPWPSYVNPPDYTDDENNYFGRIPTNILVTSSFDKTTNQQHLSKTKEAAFKQLKGSTIMIEQQEKKLSFSSSDFDDLWSEFEEYFTILDEWPVDPQEAWLIFDLHDLEYDELEIAQIKKKVSDTLTNAFIEKYDDDETKTLKGLLKELKEKVNDNGFNDKETLINNIKSISTEATVNDVLQEYRCFNSLSGISRWGWWSPWQDKVFFAIHSDYSLNNTIENILTFNTLTEPNVIKADMLVLVAGRLLNGQQRSPLTQNDITNYLEGENSDGDTHFIHAPVTSTFNDVLL